MGWTLPLSLRPTRKIEINMETEQRKNQVPNKIVCKTIKNKKISTVVLPLVFLQYLDFSLDELYVLLKSKTVTY